MIRRACGGEWRRRSGWVMGFLTPSVLVIDDDSAIREALVDALSDEGWTVATAQDGREGWRKLQAIPAPTAIVLDLQMPLMDGQEFMEALRHDPLRSSLPVIQISAGSNTAIPGVAARLDKPFHIERL